MVSKIYVEKVNYKMRNEKVKAAGNAIASFLGKCLLDARILQRNCSAVHFPHLSPLDYCLLLKVKLPPLPDVICLLQYFSHCIQR